MYSDKNFKQKYLKYKMKYLELKDSYLNIEMKGGDKPFLTNDNINLFNPTIESQKLMESYLNPVYGLYMCESGFITNSYYLHDTFTDKQFEYADKIKNLSRDINGSIQPTLEFEKIEPRVIGRYIALLYICRDNKDFIKINSNGKLNITQLSFSKEKTALLKSYKKTLQTYIDTNSASLKTAFPINNCNNMTDIDFHIILYCLWWVSKNDEGILNYYNGINEVINICNDLLSWNKDTPMIKYEPIDLEYTNSDSDGFEKLALDITKKSFHKYEMQYPQHFCPPGKCNTYPDCGEITARNLINLICFEPKTGIFNIEILKKYGAIQELIEYYQVFNTFKKQSAEETAKIYEQELNGKDAWSRLIIYHANNNLRFNKSCKNGLNYELLDGMATDGKTTNFFQLIKNLLSAITKWDDLNTEADQFKIVSDGIDTNGFGKIVIASRDHNTITISCISGHYSMDIDKKIINYDTSKLTEHRKLKIDILLNNEIVINEILNFLWINWNSELLVKTINNLLINRELRKKLLELSFTDKIKLDTRRQIIIDTQDKDGLFIYFVDTFKENKKINEYTYKSNDFKFVEQLPKLLHLNCFLPSFLKKIDLTPLSNVTSIGDNFLMDCGRLTNIDLKPLSKVTSIGNRFLEYCDRLTEIDLRSLSNLKSIGNNFLYNCEGLTKIIFPSVLNLISINNNFLSGCSQLRNINLTPLSNVESIGNHFLSDCIKLENIDLIPLSNVESIGNHFLSDCSELTEINLELLSNVESIGNHFLSNCIGLTEINLIPLSNVESIGNNFLSGCNELKNIDLTPLSKVKSIGDEFLAHCIGLTEINLEPLSKVTSIGNEFLAYCIGLTKINLESLSKVTSIGNRFLCRCSELKNINLTHLSNVKSIGNNFLSECSKLENIDLTSLVNIKLIGSNFMSNCRKLTEINLKPLSKVTSIGNSFLVECSELTEINLEPLSNVTSIGNFFLYNCIKLQNIKLDPKFKFKLTSVGIGFLSIDISIKYVNGLNGKPKINGKLIPEGESLNQYIFEEVKQVQVVE
jgi:hypothetical protein